MLYQTSLAIGSQHGLNDMHSHLIHQASASTGVRRSVELALAISAPYERCEEWFRSITLLAHCAAHTTLMPESML